MVYDAEHFFDGFRDDPRLRAALPAGGGRGGRRVRDAVRHQRRDAARRRSPAATAPVVAELGGCEVGIHTPRRRRRAASPTRSRRVRRRRAHGAGHDERLRRALRQRQPRHDHAQPPAQAGLRVPAALSGSRPHRDRALRRRALQLRAGPRTSRTWARTRSRTRAACTWPASTPTRARSSTSTRPRSATSRDVLISELSGKGTVLARAEQPASTLDDAAAARVVERVKELEHRGYQFEAADGSFDLLIRQRDRRVRAAVPARVLARDRREARGRPGRRPRPRSRSGSTASATCAPPRATAR